MEIKTFPLVELKVAAGADPGSFEGRASTFGTIDAYGDTVDPGAYVETLPEFLKRGFIGWSHDWASPIGMVTEAQEMADGLYIKGQFHSHPEAQTIRTIASERVAQGKFMGLSIGYEAEEWEERKVDVPVRNRWGEWQDKVRALTKIKLYEVSLVTVPAEAHSGLTAIKGYGLSLEDHSEQVRVALEEYLARCRAGSAQRESYRKVGRAISVARATVISGVSGSLRSAADVLDELVAGRDEADEDVEESAPVIGLSADPETEDLKVLKQQFLAEVAYSKSLKG